MFVTFDRFVTTEMLQRCHVRSDLFEQFLESAYLSVSSSLCIYAQTHSLRSGERERENKVQNV